MYTYTQQTVFTENILINFQVIRSAKWNKIFGGFLEFSYISQLNLNLSVAI